MEDCPQLMYNEGYVDDVRDSQGVLIGRRYCSRMRSSLMDIMIKEVTSFCLVDFKSSMQLKEQVNIGNLLHCLSIYIYLVDLRRQCFSVYNFTFERYHRR